MSSGAQLDDSVPVMTEYYDRKQHWPAPSLIRFEALRSRIEQWRAQASPG